MILVIMKIQIKATNLDLTPAISAYIEEKIGGLAKFLKRLEIGAEVLARVEIARTTKHHVKGDIFRAEINLDLSGNRILRAEAEDWDARVAVSHAKNILQGEIKKFKGQVKNQR